MVRENETGSIDYLHAYDGPRRAADFNTCGQAAVTTILDYYGLDPYGLEKPVYDAYDGAYHWQDEQTIDRIKERFPPDSFFGLFGTSGEQLRKALAELGGLETTVSASADPAIGREIWEQAKSWANGGFPVVVIMDRAKLGGRPLAAHWGIVYKVADGQVYLANSKGTPVVSEERFLRAFRCRFMPTGFNHCAVFSRPPG